MTRRTWNLSGPKKNLKCQILYYSKSAADTAQWFKYKKLTWIFRIDLEYLLVWQTIVSVGVVTHETSATTPWLLHPDTYDPRVDFTALSQAQSFSREPRGNNNKNSQKTKDRWCVSTFWLRKTGMCENMTLAFPYSLKQFIYFYFLVFSNATWNIVPTAAVKHTRAC